MDASWLIKDVENLEREIRDLKDDLRMANANIIFLAEESAKEHVELKKGGCTPLYPKCKFYKHMGVLK